MLSFLKPCHTVFGAYGSLLPQFYLPQTNLSSFWEVYVFCVTQWKNKLDFNLGFSCEISPLDSPTPSEIPKSCEKNHTNSFIIHLSDTLSWNSSVFWSLDLHWCALPRRWVGFADWLALCLTFCFTRGVRVSCGIVPNAPVSSVVFSNTRQGMEWPSIEFQCRP